jgi:glycosidase
MSHPGPPRFVAVGDGVELAPRDPDPAAAYRWHVVETPSESHAAVGTDPVEHFVPDVSGVYCVALDAPDGTHHLTVRAFPADYAPSGGSGASGVSGHSGASGPPGLSGGSGGEGVSGSGRYDYLDGEGRPRVRLDGERDGDTVWLSATARSGVSDDPDRSLDVEFYVDDRDPTTELAVDGWVATLPVPDEPVRVHAVSVGDSYSVPDAVRVHPDGSVERLYDPPEWATEATIYEVYVRGFAGEGGFSFDALGERLPYLADLGVDTVWLTPVLQNDHADHGYNITDFFAIAEDLGTRETFEAFVERAHDHGIRVLFDLVLNHSARDHPYFQDAYGNPESEYRDWYEWQPDGEPGTYFEWEYIANFDHSTLEVRRHLLDAVDTWAEMVDGFRCDMAWAVPGGLWMEVRDRVKAHDSEFLLLDETVPYVADFHGSMFDVHFDTTLYFTLREVGRGHAPATALLDAVEQRRRVGFPDHAGFMTYLENHDEVRYLEECGRSATLAAAGAEFLLPGVPMLYSGQEFGVRERRGAVDWSDPDEALRAHYRRLLETRAESPALGYQGGFERVQFEGDDGVVAFARTGDEERYVVVLNFGPEPTSVVLPEESVVGRDELTGRAVRSDGALSVENVVMVPAKPRER